MSRRSERERNERNEARRNAVSQANAAWAALRGQPQPPLVFQAPVRVVDPLSRLEKGYDQDYGPGEFARLKQTTLPNSLAGSAISRLDQQQQQLQQKLEFSSTMIIIIQQIEI